MKIAAIFFCLLSASIAKAQKNIDDLIAAEKNFASYSIANGTKEAFMKFADSLAIVFVSGKPVNALETWNKREKRPGVLNWHPQFAEIAASGDLGYTTGPYTFQSKSVNDSVVARGQYSTVWHKNKSGEWKFLVDLGVSNALPNPGIDVTRISIPAKSLSQKDEPFTSNDETFNNIYQKNPRSAYSQFLSSQAILERNGYLPATTPATQKLIVDSTLPDIQFIIDGSGIADTGDLAYVYGSAVHNGKTDNYLRIWRREKGGWKIALEVIPY